MRISPETAGTSQNEQLAHEEIELACEGVIALRSRVSANELSSAVYNEIYTRGVFPPHRAMWDTAFVTELMELTAGKTREVAGPLEADNGDFLVIDIDGIRVVVPAAQATIEESGVRVRVQAASIAMSPGHVSISGSKKTEPLTKRLYLAIVPSAAPVVLRDLAERLEVVNDGWWAAKLLAHPQHYTRTDAAVIYVRPKDLRATHQAVIELLANGRLELRDQSPLLTRVLAPGISTASDPPDRTMSYGQWITQLLVAACSKTENSNVAVAKFKKLVTEAGRAADSPWDHPADNSALTIIHPNDGLQAIPKQNGESL